MSHLIIQHKQDDEDKEPDFFTVVELQEVQHIMNLAGTKVDKFALLRYFCVMISTINVSATLIGNAESEDKSNFVGFVSQEYIGDQCNISNRGIINSYNQLLEQE